MRSSECRSRDLTIVDMAEEVTKRHFTKARLMHNALPEPDQLEFEAPPAEAREPLASRLHEEHRRTNLLWVASARKSFIYHDIRFQLSRNMTTPDPAMEPSLLFRYLTQSYDSAGLEQKQSREGGRETQTFYIHARGRFCAWPVAALVEY